MSPNPSTPEPEPEPTAAANPVPAPPPEPSSSSLFRNRPTSLPAPPPTASQLPHAAAASPASSSDEAPALTGRWQATPTSSPPSDKPKRRSITKEIRDEVTDLCHDGVKTVSSVLHHMLTFGSKAERDAGVWLADSEQAARIAEPAAELVLTHVPDEWLKTTFVQGLRLLFGIGNYVEDHLSTKADLRFNPPQVQPSGKVLNDQAA